MPDKTIISNYFLNWFSYKVSEKSLLGQNICLTKKIEKQTNSHSDASFCHEIAFGTIRNQAICQKDQIWCKITFLHENKTFIETVAVLWFINQLGFWDSAAMITYFVTCVRYYKVWQTIFRKCVLKAWQLLQCET